MISKRFADVVALCRATMKEQLENGESDSLGESRKPRLLHLARLSCVYVKKDDLTIHQRVRIWVQFRQSHHRV